MRFYTNHVIELDKKWLKTISYDVMLIVTSEKKTIFNYIVNDIEIIHIKDKKKICRTYIKLLLKVIQSIGFFCLVKFKTISETIPKEKLCFEKLKPN